MRDVLIDVRCLQDRDYAETGAGRRTLLLLREGREALPEDRLLGLIDPRRPVPKTVRALLDGVRSTAYPGAMTRPTCLAQLAPGAAEGLVLAPCLLHPGIPSVTMAPGRVSAVERHWLGRYDRLLPRSERFWAEVASLRPERAPAVLSGKRPRVAVLTAAGDDALLAPLRQLAEVAVFTPGPRQPVGHWPLLSARFDRVLSVVGNTPAHAHVLAASSRFGGAVMLRDPCVLAAYTDRVETVVSLAEGELGRTVAAREVERWRKGEIRPPALLLADLAGAAEPLIVHSTGLAREVWRRFGCESVVLPMPIAPASLRIGPAAPALRIAAIAAGCSAADSCVWAMDVLRSWGVDARLRLVGPERPAATALAAALGLGEQVTVADGAGDPDILLAIAMRGQESLGEALPSSIARGRPCVVTASFADAFDLPAWARTVPDQPSPLLLAEAILGVTESRPDEASIQAFRRLHDPARVVGLLCSALGVGG